MAEDAIRAAKCLDQVLAILNFIVVKRVHPFTVKACEHLVYNNHDV